MATDFLPLWIRDCTPAVIAEKIVGYCRQTNEPAKPEDVCDCSAHKLLKVNTALTQAAVAVADVATLTNEVETLKKSHASLVDDLQHTAVLLASAQKSYTDIKPLVEQSASLILVAKNEARDWKQIAATFQTKAGDAEHKHSVAADALAAIKAALKGHI